MNPALLVAIVLVLWSSVGRHVDDYANPWRVTVAMAPEGHIIKGAESFHTRDLCMAEVARLKVMLAVTKGMLGEDEVTAIGCTMDGDHA